MERCALGIGKPSAALTARLFAIDATAGGKESLDRGAAVRLGIEVRQPGSTRTRDGPLPAASQAQEQSLERQTRLFGRRAAPHQAHAATGPVSKYSLIV